MDKCISAPDWLRTSEKGSFAEQTIAFRKPEILRRIINDNDYSEEIQQRLIDLIDEIQSNSPPRPLRDVLLDTDFWNQKLYSLHGRSWFDLPWFFAESFFYRKVLEAIGYYQPECEGFMRDPFHRQKANQISTDLTSLVDSRWLFDDQDRTRSLERLMLASLWGNRADLSHMDIDLSSPALDIEGGEHLELLVNDTAKFHDFFLLPHKRIAYLTDNVGRELFSDLSLISYLLEENLAQEVTIFVKSAPFFVSDVMAKDIEWTIQSMEKQNNPLLQDFVRRLQRFFREGRLLVLSEPSLCGYQMFDEIPSSFHNLLSTFDVAILKGDANYRRAVGDRHWLFTTSVDSVLAYFPTNLLLLRTLKSEMVVGVKADQIQRLNLQYPDWLVKGFCGLIQFIQKD